MLTCTNCGASVREEARFCTSCGTRLNPPADPDATAAWPTPTDSDESPPATEEADKQSDDNRDEEQMPRDDDTPPNNDADNDDDGEFSWSWGSSSNDETKVLDEESGTEATEPDEPIDDPAPDFTEVEILDDAPSTESTGEDGSSEEPAPDTSDAELVIDEARDDEEAIDDHPADDDEASEATLAGFASSWESSSPIPLGSSDVGVGVQETDSPPAEPDDTPDDDRGESDDEDTVAKAERLIGELRSIIPALARPKPAQPTTSVHGGELADMLDEARQTEDWEDLRAALVASQQNPRDIDNMIALSGKIDRVVALLDDRDQLAQAAETVAKRLRQPDSVIIEL